MDIFLIADNEIKEKLFSKLNVDFEVLREAESYYMREEQTPFNIVKTTCANSISRALEIVKDNDEFVLITTDVVASIDDKLYKTITSMGEAYYLLENCMNKPCFYYTGTAIYIKKDDKTQVKFLYDRTRVFLNNYDIHKLLGYLWSGDYMGWVAGINLEDDIEDIVYTVDGDVNSAMGMPIDKIKQILIECGVKFAAETDKEDIEEEIDDEDCY